VVNIKDKTQRFVTIEIPRYDPERDEIARREVYKVPFTPTMRVLDAIKWIKDNIDGTLSYRWNCGMGICGSCAMEVNGVPVLTCKTELKPSMFKIRISPLKAFPTVKDLVADYTQVYEDEKALHLWFEGHVEKGKFLQFYEEESKFARKFRSCIGCMICVGNCKPYQEGMQPFLGPKSIVKAMAYDHHPKDTFDRSKLMEEKGLWNCAQTRCCQRNCPENIPITDEGIITAQIKSKKI